jgi:hypothetical protein
MKVKDLIRSFALCILFASCRTPRYIYSPAPPNNPYFREKGESKVAACYSTGADANEVNNEYNRGFDLQAAYALSDHVALTADYFKRKERDAIYDYDRAYFDSSVVTYRRHLANFGGGYFTTITNDKQIALNIFGGLGFGKFSFNDYGVDNGMNYTRYYNSNMTRWYIQPSINFFVGNHFRTALVTKISSVHYSDFQTSYTPDELSYLDLDKLPGKTLTFFEGTWNAQVSFKNMPWFCIDGGLTVSSEPFANQSTNLETRNFNASIGVSLDLSKMKKNNRVQSN